jgi:hypothetical protein
MLAQRCSELGSLLGSQDRRDELAESNQASRTRRNEVRVLRFPGAERLRIERLTRECGAECGKTGIYVADELGIRGPTATFRLRPEASSDLFHLLWRQFELVRQLPKSPMLTIVVPPIAGVVVGVLSTALHPHTVRIAQTAQ